MNIGAPWLDLYEAERRVLGMQTKLNQWATSDPGRRGMNSWRAGCSESCTSGSEGGPGKRSEGNLDTAPRSDPYTYIPTQQGWLFLAAVVDLFSRRVVGWSMRADLQAELVVDAVSRRA